MIPALDDREVALTYRAFLELMRERTIRLGSAGDEEQEAARLAIEALVHRESAPRESMFQAENEVVATRVVVRLHRDARGLVDDDDLSVVVDHPIGIEDGKKRVFHREALSTNAPVRPGRSPAVRQPGKIGETRPTAIAPSAASR